MKKILSLFAMVLVLISIVGCTTSDLPGDDEYDLAEETIYNVMFADELSVPVSTDYDDYSSYVSDYAYRAIPSLIIEGFKVSGFSSEEFTEVVDKFVEVYDTEYSDSDEMLLDIVEFLAVSNYDGEKVVDFIFGCMDNMSTVLIEFLESNELYDTDEDYQLAVTEFETELNESIDELKYDEIDKDSLIAVVDILYNDTLDYIVEIIDINTSLEANTVLSYEDVKTIVETQAILFADTYGDLTEDDILIMVEFLVSLDNVYKMLDSDVTEVLSQDADTVAEFVVTTLSAYEAALAVLADEDVLTLVYYSVYLGDDDYLVNEDMNLSLVSAQIFSAIFADGIFDREYVENLYDSLSASDSVVCAAMLEDFGTKEEFLESYDEFVVMIAAFDGIELDNDYTEEEYASVADYL